MISAMYIGVVVEATPMPSPPRMRKRMNVTMSAGSAVPRAETRNSIAARNIAGRRPNRSDTGPAMSTPAAQPARTQPEAQPFMKSPSANRAVSGSIAPEMTPVS